MADGTVDPDDDKVNVLSFQRGIRTVASNDTYVRYNFTEYDQPVSALSVCYRIKMENFVKLNTHLSYTIAPGNFDVLGFYNSESQFLTWYFGKSLTEGIPHNFDVSPETWHHLCHIFSQSRYEVYWNGKLYHTKDMDFSWDFYLNGSLVLGQEQDDFGGQFDFTQSFMGDIAQVSLWDRVLMPYQVEELASCRGVGRGNIFSTDIADMEVNEVDSTWVLVEELCKDSSNTYLMLPEMKSFQIAQSLCGILNSTVAVPQSSTDNERLTDEMLPFSDVCFPSTTWKTWIGLTDEMEEDVWRDAATNKITNYTNFGANFPHGGTLYNCLCLMTDGYWIDTDCKMTNRRCTACQMDKSDFLRFRGLCFDSEHETRFRASGYIKGRPFFYGFYDMLIEWESEGNIWYLKHTTKNRTLASISNITRNSYPLGRNIWIAVEEVCEKPPGTALKLTLSPCNDAQFMCNSGDCISHAHRCNLRYECEDGSDEVDCNRIVAGEGYQKQLPPPGPDDSVLDLHSKMTITRIANINELEMAITLEFELIMNWIDGRINLKHLKGSNTGAILTPTDESVLWKPKYQFSNLQGGKKELLEENMMVLTAYNASLPGFNDHDMDVVYSGKTNRLTLLQHYTATITCDLVFLSYPFDVQVCSIDINLPTTYDGYVQFQLNQSYMAYNGSEDLPLYTVKEFKIGSRADRNLMVFEFKMVRRPGVAILSTFLPSLLILLVSWATLFVNLQDMNVRAIMSLTTLLVLYTLFANQTSSLPKTSEVKLVDLWFFFIIFLLFGNIMMHIFVRKNSQFAVKEIKVTKVSPMLGELPPAKEVDLNQFKWIPYRYLIIYRNIIVPLLVVAFNILFWICLNVINAYRT